MMMGMLITMGEKSALELMITGELCWMSMGYLTMVAASCGLYLVRVVFFLKT
jgi:hypothetical protein